MNVKTYLDRPNEGDHDHEGCVELATLIENIVRPINTLALSENFTLHVGLSKFRGLGVALFHNTNRMALFEIQPKQSEMRVSYMSRNKMGSIHSNHAYVPLAVPGTIERIQDMIRKAVKVYSKWLTNLSKPARKRSEPKRKIKQRFAHRTR